jgi:hypothetical protein
MIGTPFYKIKKGTAEEELQGEKNLFPNIEDAF